MRQITSFGACGPVSIELPSVFSLPNLLPHELAALHVCIERSRSRSLMPLLPTFPFELALSSLLLPSCRAIIRLFVLCMQDM